MGGRPHAPAAQRLMEASSPGVARWPVSCMNGEARGGVCRDEDAFSVTVSARLVWPGSQGAHLPSIDMLPYSPLIISKK